MPNYYEILELESSATQSEVKSAIDEKHAYWNSLASHHDPEMVDKAGREKRQLEEIRATFSTKIKRKKYDASLDETTLDENIGGLAEQIHSNAPAISISAATRIITQPRAPERLDVWVCPKCRQINTIGQKFCAKCGRQLAEECPQCKQLSQIINAFCPRCGTNKAQVVKEREEKDALQKQKEALEKIKVLQDSIQQKWAEIPEIERLSKKIPFWGFDKSNKYLHMFLWADTNSRIFFMFVGASVGLLITEIWMINNLDEQYNITLVLLCSFVPLLFLFAYLSEHILYHIYYSRIIIKNMHKMIQERTSAIAQMVQEIRQLQSQS